ncbi:hypothetical protein DFJ58DRAFT_790992 [Suillus subalutaceus]|uniref:uncharacterized protein n=1 Tax=Suillus subalutaceus TaxID=48586 RepID=UPI001B872B32|nr:uncharacterized protein DFJ58DRAFT_790992 [Suillus subalutaceus]KAG1852433.1 hypothetical protein DFJ58DRAFT_790992 [Suillus subalutaceus]
MNLSSYGGRQTCKEIIEHDKLQARHNCIGSFPRRTTHSLARLALTESLDNFHTFQTLQARIQHSPVLLLPNPSHLSWSYPPSPIATHVSDTCRLCRC